MASQVPFDEKEETVRETHFFVNYKQAFLPTLTAEINTIVGSDATPFQDRFNAPPQHNQDPLDLTPDEFEEHARDPFPTFNSPKIPATEGEVVRKPAVVLCIRVDPVTKVKDYCVLSQHIPKKEGDEVLFGMKCYRRMTDGCKSSRELSLLDDRVLDNTKATTAKLSDAPGHSVAAPAPMGKGGQSDRLAAAPAAGAASAAAAVPVADSASSDPSSSSSEGSPVYGSQGIVNRRGNPGGKPQQPSGPMPQRSRITFADETNESDGSHNLQTKRWVPRTVAGPSPPVAGSSPPVAGSSHPVGEIRQLKVQIANLKETVKDQDVHIAELEAHNAKLRSHLDSKEMKVILQFNEEDGRSDIFEPKTRQNLIFGRTVFEFTPANTGKVPRVVYLTADDIQYAIRMEERTGRVQSSGVRRPREDMDNDPGSYQNGARGSSYRQGNGKPTNFDPRSNEGCNPGPKRRRDEDDKYDEEGFMQMSRGRHALGRV